MVSDRIEFTQQGDVAIITLNRPEAHNAISPDMVADLGRAVESCRGGDVRAVLIRGTEGTFCAGADVKDFVDQLEQGGPEALAQRLQDLAGALHRDVILGIRRLEKPVIASIDGVAAGAGFGLMLACDVRIASSSARFLMAYANIGATADGGSTFLLPRLVGAGKAMDIYLASQPLSVQGALEMGLVSQVCPAEDLDRHSLETAVRLAQGPTLAYGRVKALFDRSWEADLASHLDAETEAISGISRTGDFQEGIRAFVDKRRPWFQGR
jgi:2-(1,2-epoxy-1,2-dihydrophenyl)acetyl-CoA isomerase